MTAADDLGRLADALPYLGLMRTSRPPQSGERVRTSRDPAAPLRLDTLDLMEHVHATLTSWVRLAIEEEVTDDDWPSDSSLACCMWLQRNAAALEQHEAGAEFADEIAALWRKVRNALGEREPRQMRHACTRCGNPSALINDGELWACPECGHGDPGPRVQIDQFRHAPSEPTPVICDRFGVTSQWLADQKRRRGLKADESKGQFPRHWWPWDVFRLLHPGLVEMYERHAEVDA